MAQSYSYIHVDTPLVELTKGYSAVYVVADKRFYDEGIEQFGLSGILGYGESGVSIFWVNADENEKTVETACEIASWLIGLKADRDALLIGIGGGLITDLTGYVGATYKRGIAVGYVPTTLVGMIDASIGGKCGVNFWGLKNMLGVIRQPVFVDLLSAVCKNWSDEVISDGYPEALKMDLLKGRFNEPGERPVEYYRDIEHILGYAVEKLQIVEQDPGDRKGIRAQLNLGHTYGHALEAISKGRISHGEAVATGLVLMAQGREDALEKRLIEDLTAHGVQLHLDEYFPEELQKYIANDKKVVAGDIQFVDIP